MNEQGRVPRRDQRVLAGYVVSAPVTPSEYESDPAAKEAVDRYFERSLTFLERYLADTGGEIVSAAAHIDESYVHMHVLATPSGVPGYRADALHPAKAAQRAARAQGAAPLTARAEGQAALEDFLDRFHAEVGDQFGLMRKTAEVPRPRVARQQIIEERRQLTEQLTERDAEPAVSTPEGVDTVGRGAWHLEDFVPGADARLASLSSEWWTHEPVQELSHQEESRNESTSAQSPGGENKA